MRITNLVTIHDIFTINGKKYQIVDRIYNNNQKRERFVIQSLYDNGKRFSKWRDELESTLYLHRSENVSIFGKKIANG